MRTKHTGKTGRKLENTGKIPALSRTVPASSRVLTRRFIADFNFANPNWSNLPKGYPHLPKKGLTIEEELLLDATKTAWIIDGGGRAYFYKTIAKRTMVVVAAIFILAAGGYLAKTSQTSTNTVNAKTVSQKVEGVVQATMSAVFRR